MEEGGAGGENRAPLCDLYGSDVFARDVESRAGRSVQEERKELGGIRAALFGAGRSRGEEELEQIRRDVFLVQPGFTKTERTVQGEKTENTTGILIFQMLVLIFFLFQKWRKVRTGKRSFAEGKDL